MLETISQVAIFVFGITGIALIGKKNKWGFVFGLLVQPFWFYTAFVNQQWGIFFVSIAYTISWSYGIYQWFYKDRK